MRSYIKIFGPPHVKALRALKKIAVDMPEVCIMDTTFVDDLPPYLAEDLGGRRTEGIRIEPTLERVGAFFRSQGVEISEERCNNIISEYGEMLGDYDFFFEWFEDPSVEQVNDLIQKIDEALEPLDCHYTITQKRS
jgi:hypothetical protein